MIVEGDDEEDEKAKTNDKIVSGSGISREVHVGLEEYEWDRTLSMNIGFST